MKKRVAHIAVAQCGKMLAGIYFLVSLPLLIILIPIAITMEAVLGVVAGITMIIICPLMYALAAYLGGILTAWLYNVVAARFGGFEYTTMDARSDSV